MERNSINLYFLGGEGQYPFIPLGGEGQYLIILLSGEQQRPFILWGGERQCPFILLGGEGQYPFILPGKEGQYLFIIMGEETHCKNFGVLPKHSTQYPGEALNPTLKINRVSHGEDGSLRFSARRKI